MGEQRTPPFRDDPSGSIVAPRTERYYTDAAKVQGPFSLSPRAKTPTSSDSLVWWGWTAAQLDPKNVADQLKRQGASIPGVRPGRATSDFIQQVLERMSILGSGFLGLLAVTPGLVEAVTHLEVRVRVNVGHLGFDA